MFNIPTRNVVVNDAQFAYNDMSQVTTTYQSHSGAVNTSTSPNLQYTYDSSVASNVFSAQHRLQSLVYPNGRTVYSDYGSSGTATDVLSRVKSLRDTNSTGTPFATYDYNGAGSRVALVDLPEPDLKLDYFQGTSGTYAGWDRFGRVIDQYWKGYNSTPDADRIRYGYDYAGSRTYRDIDAAIYSGNDKDQAYTYDNLHRLSVSQQGTLSGSTISGTPTKEENWTLDALGNWGNYVTKTAGTTDLNQSRTNNSVNEITGITETVGSSWIDPAYDAAGNMTTIPQPNTPTSSYAATYDAWNRLVKLADGSSTVSEYAYDGRNFRTVQKSYTAGSLTETRHFYYNTQWQVLEERVDTATIADRQFVWGARYIDELILRDRGAERLYPIQDANWNVTALTNSSGAVQERYIYSPYGQPMYFTATFGNRSASNFTWETLYCGYRFESGTGLFHVRNRAYQSTLGNWVQRDPIEYGDYENLYCYVYANPVILIDPSGTRVDCLGGSGFIGWIGGVSGSASICRDTCGNVATVICAGGGLVFGGSAGVGYTGSSGCMTGGLSGQGVLQGAVGPVGVGATTGGGGGVSWGGRGFGGGPGGVALTGEGCYTIIIRKGNNPPPPPPPTGPPPTGPTFNPTFGPGHPCYNPGL